MNKFVPHGCQITLDSYDLKGWQRIKTKLHPSSEQKKHLNAFVIMIIGITVAYQFPVTKLLLYPFELVSTVFHEFGHAFVTVLTGGRVAAIEINMNESGVTRFVGGWPCFILPAGYCGSSLAGAVLLILSFGEKSAKAGAIGIGLVLLATVYWAGTPFTVFSVIFMILALLGVYFGAPKYLPKVILFMGVMGSLMSLLLIFSHLISNTIDGSDAVQFAKQCSVFVPSIVYGISWFLFSVILITASMVLGIYLYK